MKVWTCALIIIFACAKPTSSRAYIPPYVPPQPPAKRYKVVKVLKAHVTRYIKPERHYYSSEKEFRQAIKLNGEGKETIFGTAPRENFTIAANLKRFKRGTILRIKGSDIDLICKIDDRCAAAEKIWKKKRIVQFDIFSKMTPTQALEWGKQNLTVEILQEKL